MNYYPSNSACIELPVTKPQQQGCEFYLNNVRTWKSYLEMCDAMIIVVFPNKKQTEMQKKKPTKNPPYYHNMPGKRRSE